MILNSDSHSDKSGMLEPMDTLHKSIYAALGKRVSTQTKAVIKRVVDANPDLSYEGWSINGDYPRTACAKSSDFQNHRTELYSPESLVQIGTAIAFCQNVDLHPQATSYTIKHAMENWGRAHGMSSYIANGCAIAGALTSGYHVVRIKNSVNCYLRVAS